MSSTRSGHLEDADQPRGQQVYSFALLISAHEITAGLEDALFAAGCDDALLHSQDGRVYLNFDREAESGQKAIMSAIQDAESVDGLTVVRVLPVGASAINLANAYLKMRKSPSWKKLL